jgi:opacity protein-like surface antigen
MIRKFVAVALLLLVMGGAKGVAQEAPSPQQPGAQEAPPPQQPSAQENPEEESSSRRKVRPHDYRKWTFNAGGGANLANGTTRTFVRGGGGVASGGVARNYSRYFGFRLDLLWADLPLRASALQLAQAPSGTDHALGVTLDPIFNIPVTKKYSGYFVVGPGFYHRSGKLDSSTAVPGSACNGFWSWWGRCFNGSIPLDGKFLTSSQNEFGFNFGGGVARKVGDRLEVYGEFRYLHGKHNEITTDFRPITIGIRW